MNTLLLLHGALGASDQLIPLENKLKHIRTTLRFDFSGHAGKEFEKNFGIEQFAEDVINFLDEQNIETVDIFGYSMGGYVALWLAYEHPHRIGKIVTLGTKFDWSEASAEKEVKKLNADKIIEKVPAFARILEHRHAPNDWKELLQRTANMMHSLGKQPLLTDEILATIQNQAEICLGELDDMADREYTEHVATVLPRGNFHLLEGTPHPIEKVELDKFVVNLLMP